MDLWRTSMFSTKAMYCVDCKKRVQVDLSKRNQCPDCLSFKVTEMNQAARSRSQAPAQVASRPKRTVVRPGQRVNIQHRASGETGQRAVPRREPREETKQRGPTVNLRAKVPVQTRVLRGNPAPSRPEPRPAPRPEPRPAFHPIREESYPAEQHRPRPLYPDSDSEEEVQNTLIQPRERPGALRRVRLIRINSPFEAFELFHFLPQRQAAVLYFIMQGLGLFGIPQAESGLGSFEDFLTSIVSSQADSVQPASREYLERMETAKVTREMERKGEICTICLAAFKAGEYANRLPCRHIFHGECVVPWLRTRNTCPVCRQVVDS